MFSTVLLLAGTALAAPIVEKRAGTISCPIVFDGRIPTTFAATPSNFDTYATNTIYNPDYVKGNNLKWSEILKFPNVTASRFEGTGNTPFEVTISDESIFQTQNGFRRAGLQFLKDDSAGVGQTGVKTLHFSVKQDPTRPLNLTHEYLNAWHETADYSADQIQFQAGQLINGAASDKSNFKILDRNYQRLWQTPIDFTQWQNFAITLDYTSNKVTIYYSLGDAVLTKVYSSSYTNLSGGGQYQLGILKKPTGSTNVVNNGYQESGLNEGQIYGGVFLEDSAGGCVSL